MAIPFLSKMFCFLLLSLYNAYFPAIRLTASAWQQDAGTKICDGGYTHRLFDKKE